MLLNTNNSDLQFSHILFRETRHACAVFLGKRIAQEEVMDREKNLEWATASISMDTTLT
jgi:hypothetical protein